MYGEHGESSHNMYYSTDASIMSVACWHTQYIHKGPDDTIMGILVQFVAHLSSFGYHPSAVFPLLVSDMK